MVQRRFREGSDMVQRRFREGSDMVQRRFRKGSEKVQGSEGSRFNVPGFKGLRCSESQSWLKESSSDSRTATIFANMSANPS
jgi:hypothetical protein